MCESQIKVNYRVVTAFLAGIQLLFPAFRVDKPLDEMELPDEFTKTLSGNRFLFYDSRLTNKIFNRVEEANGGENNDDIEEMFEE